MVCTTHALYTHSRSFLLSFFTFAMIQESQHQKKLCDCRFFCSPTQPPNGRCEHFRWWLLAIQLNGKDKTQRKKELYTGEIKRDFYKVSKRSLKDLLVNAQSEYRVATEPWIYRECVCLMGRKCHGSVC